MKPDLGITSLTFVLVSDILGGGELFTLRLAERLADRYALTIAGTPESPAIAYANQCGLITEELCIGRKLGRRTALRNAAMAPAARSRLRKFIQRRGVTDWVVFQYTWEKILWQGSSGWSPAKIAVIEHGPLPSPLLGFRSIKRRLSATYCNCDALFAVSQPAAVSLRSLSERPSCPLRAGVDPELVNSAVCRAASVRSDLQIPNGAPLLVYAGRLARNKGIFDLVGAARRNAGLHVLFLGEGPDSDELSSDAESCGSRIIMLGRVADALPYLAAADATCLLTTDPGEGRPQLAVESVAVGTPVLASSTSSAMQALVAEKLAEGIHLVDPSHKGEIDAGIQQILATQAPPAMVRPWTQVADEFITELQRSTVASSEKAGK